MAIDGRRYRLLTAMLCAVSFSCAVYYSRRYPAFQQQPRSVWRHPLVPPIATLDSYEVDDYDQLGLDYVDHGVQPDDTKLSQRNSVEQGNVSYRELQTVGAPFNYTNNDVLVFLHIQKTGGTTFERYLVKQLQLATPCRCQKKQKRCRCNRPPGSAGSSRSPWLFSRFSTGWYCGLHSDWTELVASGCVDKYFDKRDGGHTKRRYFLATFLRQPVTRFVSEHRHVQRGATWQASRHMCNGRRPTPVELPPCFDAADGWSGVTLDEFLACPSNLAFDRQTRMLADLTLVACYNRSAMEPSRRDFLLLQSAKANLAKMAFFGLQDEMRKSQYLFERTFNLTFVKPMVDMQVLSTIQDLTGEQRRRIEQVNQLDIALYQYGRQLFYQRFEMAKRVDPLFHVNIAT